MTGRIFPAAVLKDVVAYVDVWSASRMEDYSDPFIQQLLDMGAEVSKTLNKQVTHVVFKHGRPSTWKKAQKMGVRLVSVHWVASCKESGEHVEEDLFPAQNEESKYHLLNKRTHRCMQPRDIPVKTPENDRRMKKKLDRMMEGLISSSPVVSDTSPFIIDEESGIVYSPSLKRSDSMAQRLREMRAQREYLSPTASQMQDSGSGSDTSLRPSLVASPTLSFLQQLEEEPLDGWSTSHQRSSKSKDERGNQKENKKKTTKIASKSIIQTPPESNTPAMGNLSSTEKNPKIPALTSRSRRSSVNIESKKQSTLESYINKTCSENKPSTYIKHQPETESFSNPEIPRSSLPEESLKKTNNSQMLQYSKDLKTNSKHSYTRKLSSATRCPTGNDVFQKSEPGTPVFVHKVARQRRPSALRSADSFGQSSDKDVDDGEAFEDLFSPANNARKQRVILLGSASEPVNLPTFDLVDLNKKKDRKSSGRKRKLENIDIKEIMFNCSRPSSRVEEVLPETPESRPECLSMDRSEMSTSEEFKKLQPSAKKQRRRTRMSSVMSPEGEDGDGSVKSCPANERKRWTANSLTSSTAVNVKMRVKSPEPPPQHSFEKRMGLKIVGKENKSTTDGLIGKTSEMCSKWETMKKDKYMKARQLITTVLAYK